MSGWNHNIAYHPLVLRSAPAHCDRALDVGCGRGLMTRQLAARCGHVIGIDVDPEVLTQLPTDEPFPANVSFIVGDVMEYPLAAGSFDFIAAVAALHHLPLSGGLERLRDLLRPGGVLTVIGLYRMSAWSDYILAAVAQHVSLLLRHLRPVADVRARLRDPYETLADIRRVAEALLPGVRIRRRLFFRYSLVWHKPQ